MAKYIDNTNLGYLIGKIKAAFWPKTDVTNVTLADVAVTGDYDDLINKPSPGTPKATTIPSGGMLPNVYYALGRISSNTTFTRNTTGLDSSIVNVWSFGFEVSGTPTITWPSSIVWAGGTAPTISDGNHYEISILEDWAMFAEFEDPTSGYNPPIDDDD